MTELQELRKALDEATAQIEEGSEFVRKSLQRVEEARLRILKAAGIRTEDEQHRE
jgi:exonuclease VII small subunit